VIAPDKAPPLPEELERALRRMRLPHMREAAPEVLAAARAQRWDPAEALRVLLAEEIDGRDRASREARRRAAGLPSGKTFESWRRQDSSIPPGTQDGLAALEWVGRRENLALAGPSGTGKSHFAEALCHKAIEADMRVAWFTTEDLGALVTKASADGSASRIVKQVCRADVIVIDDVGLLPVSAQAAEGFYRIVEAAYEKRSVVVTSNLHPSGFDQIMPKTVATAAVDRLLHHAHVVLTEGESHRLAEATGGRGVMPLA
jgi:DNA replication protein DnaC